MPSDIERMSEAILDLDEAGFERLVDEFLVTRSPLQVAEDVISPSLQDIGVMWEEGRANLAQIYLGSKMCEETLQRILPKESKWRRDAPIVAITNYEDHHSLGKSIVYMTMRSEGFEVADLGWTDAKTVAEKVKQSGAQVLMVSTLMLRSALRTKEIPGLIEMEGCHVMMVVGGAPFIFDPELGKEVGADAVGSNGTDASSIIHALMEGAR
jgi:methanogenic corrinoid protein MtbC1